MSVSMTNAELKRSGVSKSKLGNVRTSCGSHMHASKREAIRCGELQLMEKAHMISGLRIQVPVPLEVNGKPVCKYVADFIYMRDGQLTIEDSKGYRTDVYRIKKKLVAAVMGMEIVES